MDSIKIDPRALVTVTIVCEAGLLLLATCWCFSSGVSLKDALRPDIKSMVWGTVAGAATAASGFIALALAGKSKENSTLQKLRAIVLDDVAPMFSRVSLMDIFLIAVSSGFCEEIFFRGVLQMTLGIVPASILFGLVHCASLVMLPYALWTFFAGIFLGYLYIWTGSLWAAIFAHAINNLIVILFFRYRKESAPR